METENKYVQATIEPKNGFRRIHFYDRKLEIEGVGYFHGWHTRYAIHGQNKGFTTVAIIEQDGGQIYFADTFYCEMKFIDEL